MRAIASSVCMFVLLLWVFSCEGSDDPLALTISVSGNVTNNSGYSGTVIVEIDYNKRDIADGEGRYSIPLHKDYYIDSLNTKEDQNKNIDCSSREPC